MSAAAIVRQRLDGEWSAEKLKLDRLIHAAAAGQRMPENYWQAEHDARRRVRVAAVLAEEMARDA